MANLTCEVKISDTDFFKELMQELAKLEYPKVEETILKVSDKYKKGNVIPTTNFVVNMPEPMDTGTLIREINQAYRKEMI